MKNIAILAPNENPIPPPGYGGTERRIAIIVDKLLARGLAVDLYCHRDSKQSATRLFPAPNPSMSAQDWYVDEIQRQAKANWMYDAILDFTNRHVTVNFPDYWPVISEMNGDPYKKYAHDVVRNRIYVSREFAAFCGCPNHPAVHNIVHKNPTAIPLGKGNGGYLLYIGVIRPEKGLELATMTAERAGLPLHVYGPIRDFALWDKIRDRVKYKGMLGGANRWEIFGGAIAFLHPSLWCDAGPLTTMEAMAAGTPVVGLANGGAAGDVVDGIGGFLLRGATNIGLAAPRPVGAILGPTGANVAGAWNPGPGMPCGVPPVSDYPAVADWLAIAVAAAAKLDRAAVKAAILPLIDPDKCANDIYNLCRKVNEGARW